MRRYVARYTFDGRGWVVQFEKPDIATFGRSLASAKLHARSLLAVWLELDDLSAAGAEVLDQVELPRGTGIDVDGLVHRRARAEALRRELAVETRDAARDLRAAGLSTRDVGEILGVSGSRVAQLEHGTPIRSQVRQATARHTLDEETSMRLAVEETHAVRAQKRAARVPPLCDQG